MGVRLLPLLLLVTACGLNTDIESQVTITQGVYGQLTQKGAPRTGTPVAWFDQSPYASDAGVKPTPLFQTTSKANGVFELSIDSNTRGYLAIGEDRTNGTQWFTATSALIPRGLTRIDWQTGPGSDGTWTNVR